MRPDPWQRLKSQRYQAKNRAKLAAKSKHHERRDDNQGKRPISNAENITEDSVYLSENDDFDDEEAYDISRVDQVTLDTIIAEVSSLSTCADYKIDINDFTEADVHKLGERLMSGKLGVFDDFEPYTAKKLNNLAMSRLPEDSFQSAQSFELRTKGSLDIEQAKAELVAKRTENPLEDLLDDLLAD